MTSANQTDSSLFAADIVGLAGSFDQIAGGSAHVCTKLRKTVHRVIVAESLAQACKMASTERLNTTIDRRLAERLHKETDGRMPRLPKRYVVELALQRLFDAADRGQVELGLATDGKPKSK